jgi:hypothetical protein
MEAVHSSRMLLPIWQTTWRHIAVNKSQDSSHIPGNWLLVCEVTTRQLTRRYGYIIKPLRCSVSNHGFAFHPMKVEVWVMLSCHLQFVCDTCVWSKRYNNLFSDCTNFNVWTSFFLSEMWGHEVFFINLPKILSVYRIRISAMAPTLCFYSVCPLCLCFFPVLFCQTGPYLQLCMKTK